MLVVGGVSTDTNIVEVSYETMVDKGNGIPEGVSDASGMDWVYVPNTGG